jgi:methylated-DNA-[protein]-cysteine S-methyltransferase
MSHIHIQYFESPVGELMMGSYGERLCLCDWRYRRRRDAVDARLTRRLGAEYVERNDDILETTRRQLTEYLEQRRRTFEIPLLLVGTPFQKRVWRQLLDIPFGETKSYLALARAIGDQKAVRAVAGANGANAISIIVPCHRVIGSNGQLVGYAGGIKTKAHLLGLEFELTG